MKAVMTDASLEAFHEMLRAGIRSELRKDFSLPRRADLEAMATDARLVYFVECHGLLKVGSAGDVSDRVSALQVGCPYELKLWGTIKGGQRAEEALHRALAGFRFRGEWFMAPVEVRRAVRGLLDWRQA